MFQINQTELRRVAASSSYVFILCYFFTFILHEKWIALNSLDTDFSKPEDFPFIVINGIRID